MGFLTTIIALSVCEAFGQSTAFLSFKRKSLALFMLSWAIYLGVIFFLVQSYKYKGVGIVNVMWSGVIGLIMLAVGYFAFGERLSIREWIGVALVFAGIFVINK